MDILTKEELSSLVETRGEFCASIYMPTHRSGNATEQNAIRFKNRLADLEKQFEALEAEPASVDEWLADARALVEDNEFWQHQSDGLAMFIGPEKFCYYRLPRPFEELTILVDRFHVKPLMPLLAGDGLYYVLALSQNDVRLLRGSKHTINQVELEGMPKSLSEALRHRVDTPSLQFHSGTGGSGGGQIYHGQGTGTDDQKQKIREYFREIDRGVRELLSDDGRGAPLVLAGVDYLFPLYEEVNSYPQLLEQGVPGNPEHLSGDELHKRSWELVEPVFTRKLEQERERYGDLVKTQQTSKNLREVVKAAYEGRVATLFVREGEKIWGFYHPDEHEVKIHSEREAYDEDLLDLAAFQSFAHGGQVFVVNGDTMPGDEPIAAIYRG